MKYQGIIIEESLSDNRILNNIHILKLYITEAAKKATNGIYLRWKW